MNEMGQVEIMRCKCVKCGWRGMNSGLLSAANPFEADEYVIGCPDCRGIDTIIEVTNDDSVEEMKTEETTKSTLTHTRSVVVDIRAGHSEEINYLLQGKVLSDGDFKLGNEIVEKSIIIDDSDCLIRVDMIILRDALHTIKMLKREQGQAGLI